MTGPEENPAGTPVPAPGDGPRVPLLRRMNPVLFSLFALALIFVLYQIVGGVITIVVARGEITLSNVTLVRWATLLGQVLFILVPTVWLARARHGMLPEFFRFHLPEIRHLVATMVAVVALQQMLQAYMVAQDMIPLPGDLQKILDTLRKLLEETERVLVQANGPGEFLFVLLVVAVVPAVSEELLFRGLVQRNLEAAGGWRGPVITGIIFGLYHFNPFTLVPLVALGVYFGFIVYRSGNITLSMSAHFFNNFIACSATYLRLDDNFVALAPGSAPTLKLAASNFAVFTLVFVAATLYFVKSTAHDEPGESI